MVDELFTPHIGSARVGVIRIRRGAKTHGVLRGRADTNPGPAVLSGTGALRP
jgi:hypothetical protein